MLNTVESCWMGIQPSFSERKTWSHLSRCQKVTPFNVYGAINVERFLTVSFALCYNKIKLRRKEKTDKKLLFFYYIAWNMNISGKQTPILIILTAPSLNTIQSNHHKGEHKVFRLQRHRKKSDGSLGINKTSGIILSKFPLQDIFI